MLWTFYKNVTTHVHINFIDLRKVYGQRPLSLKPHYFFKSIIRYKPSLVNIETHISTYGIEVLSLEIALKECNEVLVYIKSVFFCFF